MKKQLIIFILMVSSLLVGSPLFAQNSGTNQTVTGTVTDPNGEPLIGATVLVSGTTNGVSTTYTGSYSIAVPAGKSLSFQYLGYESKTEKVGSRSTLNVILEQSKQTIDEVVVIGYGSVKKTDLTGSVSNVKMGDIRDVPTVSVDQALQGRIAGADIMSTTGEPGATTSIRIRGTRSISASNEPLIIVDGVIDGIRDLNDINSSDIESISVLKDASSTAIYGARGSNGVLVITTKKGHGAEGKPNITFKTDLGFSQLPRKLDIMNSREFARYRNDYAYFANADGYEEITPDSPLSLYPFPNPDSYGKGTDWVDVITRTALYQNYDLSVSGSTKKSSYYASAGYNQTQGIIDNSGLSRYSTRFNIDHKFTKWLTAGLKLSYTYRDQDNNLASIGGTSFWRSAIYLNPFLKPDSDLNDLWYSGQKYNSPRIMIDHCIDNTRRITLNNSGFVEVTPVKGLKLRSQFTYYSYQRHNRYYEPGILPAKKEGEGAYASRSEYDDTSFLSENTIYYELRPKSGHNFDVLAGYTAQVKYDNNIGMNGKGYSIDQLTWNNMGAIPDKQNIGISSSHTDYTKMSVFGRLNYNYKERYYVTATLRYDGASNFASNNKWGLFPSAAVKWNIHNEKFMKSAKWLDELALRLSVGRSGNDAISAYRSLSAMSSTTGGYLFGGSQQVAFYPGRLASPDLTWETTDMYNAALDLALFGGRLNVTAEAYLVKTRDLLLTIQMASQTGYTSRFANAGRTNNKGFEISIESRNIVKPHFQWSTSFTLSRNKQMVEDIASEDFVTAYSSPSSAGTTYMMYGYKKDYALNALWGFRFAGIWHDDEQVARNKVTKAYASASNGSYKPGYARYQDINHDGVLNNNDLVYLGSADPDVYGGIQNTFNIHNFTLNVFFNYSLGGKIYNISELYMGNGSPFTNQYRYMQNSWHPVRNPDSNLPFAGSNDAIPSDRMVHDASYLRLKNISASYTFDMRKLTKGRLRDLRLSVSGENLYLWKKYNGFDPDVSSSSSNSTLRRVDIGAYPKPRTIIFSLQLRY
ncbi:MAG: TonB-dependent receptor [Alistipes sp.]